MYYNDAGEPLGWDYPSDEFVTEPDELYYGGEYDLPDLTCGCFSDQGKHTCDEKIGLQVTDEDV